MKVPFWRLVLCFFGSHGPEEEIRYERYTCYREPKVQCLYCGHVRNAR